MREGQGGKPRHRAEGVRIWGLKWGRASGVGGGFSVTGTDGQGAGMPEDGWGQSPGPHHCALLNQGASRLQSSKLLPDTEWT